MNGEKSVVPVPLWIAAIVAAAALSWAIWMTTSVFSAQYLIDALQATDARRERDIALMIERRDSQLSHIETRFDALAEEGRNRSASLQDRINSIESGMVGRLIRMEERLEQIGGALGLRQPREPAGNGGR